MLACFVIIILIVLIGFLIDRIIECENLKISIKIEKLRTDRWYETYMEECRAKAACDIELMQLKSSNNQYKMENETLKIMTSTLLKSQKSIPEGTIDAVKYAVKKSHPDNGGNSADFIRFKKCLDELEG